MPERTAGAWFAQSIVLGARSEGSPTTNKSVPIGAYAAAGPSRAAVSIIEGSMDVGASVRRALRVCRAAELPDAPIVAGSLHGAWAEVLQIRAPARPTLSPFTRHC